jgi:hypothetical protein
VREVGGGGDRPLAEVTAADVRCRRAVDEGAVRKQRDTVGVGNAADHDPATVDAPSGGGD